MGFGNSQFCLTARVIKSFMLNISYLVFYFIILFFGRIYSFNVM